MKFRSIKTPLILLLGVLSIAPLCSIWLLVSAQIKQMLSVSTKESLSLGLRRPRPYTGWDDKHRRNERSPARARRRTREKRRARRDPGKYQEHTGRSDGIRLHPRLGGAICRLAGREAGRRDHTRGQGRLGQVLHKVDPRQGQGAQARRSGPRRTILGRIPATPPRA